MADTSFTEFVREQLAGLPEVGFRRMFGGQGVYLGETFFGILHEDRLYFKTDAETRPAYEATGMGPFQPNAKQCLPTYREVPAAVLEESARLCEWAIRAAQCTPEKKPVGKPKQPARR